MRWVRLVGCRELRTGLTTPSSGIVQTGCRTSARLGDRSVRPSESTHGAKLSGIRRRLLVLLTPLSGIRFKACATWAHSVGTIALRGQSTIRGRWRATRGRRPEALPTTLLSGTILAGCRTSARSVARIATGWESTLLVR